SYTCTAPVTQASTTPSILQLAPVPNTPLLPYTTLFRSADLGAYSGGAAHRSAAGRPNPAGRLRGALHRREICGRPLLPDALGARSEEHTSELQSRFDLVCRLLLEKQKQRDHTDSSTSSG